MPEYLFTGLCTLVGTLGGILTAQSLVNWRLSQLEKRIDNLDKKVDNYHTLDRRIAIIEERVNSIGKDSKTD